MAKSGLLLGIISLVFVLGTAVLITPVCAPCAGVFLGIIAGYLAGVFDKPTDSGKSMRRGAGAGAIAGALALVGGFIGAAINGALLNPTNMQTFFDRVFGYSNFVITQPVIWLSELGAAFCVGLFDILWMALLGLLGGAIWYSLRGGNRTGTAMTPQQPLPPAV